jgi:hypothetical protein
MSDWNASAFFQTINTAVNNLAGVSNEAAQQSNALGQMIVGVLLVVMFAGILYFLFKKSTGRGIRG